MTRSEAQTIVKKFDTNGDGYVDIREFADRICDDKEVEIGREGVQEADLVVTETGDQGSFFLYSNAATKGNFASFST